MPGQTTHFVGKLSQEDWDILSQATDRLERSWQTNASGEEPDLRQFVPTAGDLPLRRRVLIELLKIDQERRWSRGQKKFLEVYLKEWPELRGDAESIRELLEAECLTRAGLGDLPTQAELERRFPKIGDSVDLLAISDQVDCEGLPLNQVLPKLPVPPEFIGRFQILSEIGSGGMGTVFRAFDPKLDRPVALKIPHIDPKRESEMAAQFQQEAMAAAKIKHPNICVIHDAGTADGKPYLVMDFIPGQNLEARLSQGSLPQNEAVTIVSKLAEALSRFHQKGLIHRDVKPSNVMLKDDGEPILTDFGLAQQTYTAAGTTIPKSLRGTPAYIAPEILNDKEQPPDARSDVYSLGVLLYHCLAGSPPFRGELTEVLRDVAKGEPPALRQFCPLIDASLEKICQRAMAKSPGDRFQSASDLAFALKLWSEQPKRPRFLQALAITSGVGFLILLGILIWTIVTRPEMNKFPLPNSLAQTDSLTSQESVESKAAGNQSQRQIAGAPVSKLGKSEPGGAFENAWVLPLDEKNVGQFSDKIDPASDRDTYLIEARQTGFMEFFVQPEPSVKLRVTLYGADEDKDLDGQPDSLNASQSFEGHDFCQMSQEVSRGHRLYLRVESPEASSHGQYEIQVRPLEGGMQFVPGRAPSEDSEPGPPIDALVLKELQDVFTNGAPRTWSEARAEHFRRRLVELCQIHCGHPEVRELARWLTQLPWPNQDAGEFRWIDFTLPGGNSKRLKIPPHGTLIIRNRTTEKYSKWLHIVEGGQPGSLAIQFIPLEEGTGGFCDVSWEHGSDSFANRTQPPYYTYHNIVGSAPSNIVNLRVNLRGDEETLTGEYVLLLWQPEEITSRQSTDLKGE